MITIVGKTECGKYCVSGLFHLQTSIGLPLDIIVEELKSHDLVPAWDRYVWEALDGGWFGDTIYKTLIQQDLDIPYIKMTMLQVLQQYKYPDEEN